MTPRQVDSQTNRTNIIELFFCNNRIIELTKAQQQNYRAGKSPTDLPNNGKQNWVGLGYYIDLDFSCVLYIIIIPTMSDICEVVQNYMLLIS